MFSELTDRENHIPKPNTWKIISKAVSSSRVISCLTLGGLGACL